MHLNAAGIDVGSAEPDVAVPPDRSPEPVRRFVSLTADRIKAHTATMAKSLEGNWCQELLFNLRQSLELSACDQQKIAACDLRLEAHLHTCDSKLESPDPPLPTPTRQPKNARRPEPTWDLHTPLDRLSGVDLTRLDGIEVLTAQPLIAEIGLDMSRWKTEKPFASWLG